MAETSSIEWTDATWNPITGCTLVSEGCRHCYAATLAATRLKGHPSRAGLARLNAAGEAKFTGEVRFNDQWLDQPLRWRRPRMIFVCAHGDLFHEAVPDAWIDRVFAVMARATWHTFQVLTKRPERARAYLEVAAVRCWEWQDPMFGGPMFDPTYPRSPLPLRNVWLGTSVEDQAAADARIPHLLAAPAAVRFLSAEPLLGPVDLTGEYLTAKLGEYPFKWLPDEHRTKVVDMLDWVIVGGESGPDARPMHPAWARSLRDQCQAAGVAFFFKQWGHWALSEIDAAGRLHPSLPIGGPFARVRVWRAGWFVNPPPGAKAHEVLGPGNVIAIPIGKAASGRLLDGQEWNDMPRRAHG